VEAVSGCQGGPYAGAVRKLVTTGKVTAPDAMFSDALFLVNHPNWTYQQLQDTPATVVDLMLNIEHGRASVQEARRKKEGA
jgi:hypothetical protein